MDKAFSLFFLNDFRGFLNFFGVFVVFVDFKKFFDHTIKCLHIVTVDELSGLGNGLPGMSGGFEFAELEDDFGEFLVLHDLGEDEGLDFSHFVGTVFVTEDFVDSSEGPSQGGIEMIFDGIVSPML